MVAIATQEGFFKDGTLALKNNNPGNIKYGPFARRQGAIDKDEQNHAIFPSPSVGWEALRVLLNTKFKGQSLEEIGRHYAEDPEWATQVAKIAGMETDTIVA